MASFAMIQEGDTRKFPVNGQGILIYTKKVAAEGEDFVIYVTPENRTDRTIPKMYIALKVERGSAKFTWKKTNGAEEDLIVKPDEKCGYDAGRLVSYWYSYDRDACILKYGKGYRMVETTLLKYDFLEGLDEKAQEKKRKEIIGFFSPAVPRYVMVFNEVQLKTTIAIIDVEPAMQFERDPLVGNLPPVVKDSSELTLFDIDRNEFMFSRSLPMGCQELYYNVKGLELEYPENPIMKLADALRYSLETPNMMLNKILDAKKYEFGDDPTQVYIRVTLGPDMRSGPGIPYVLEIWPKGCKSPVHNHGAANAIIKVLFGQIQISVYNKDISPPRDVDEFITKLDAKEGQVVWMDANWYQRHELKNTTNDFCATIQCYRYAADDTIHWPGFDFVTHDQEGSATDTFWPNSDTTFLAMRSQVLQEFDDFLSGKTKAT